MNKFNCIITHPGSTHRDDFVACCIALALNVNPLPILRREPLECELESPSCLVLDVGEKHDIYCNNYDHHQLPRDAKPTCALSLFAEAMHLSDSLSLMKWWQPTVVIDSKGPLAWAKLVGLATFPEGLFSPVEQALLEWFEQHTTIEPGSVLYEAMRRIGHVILAFATSFKKAYDKVCREAHFVDLGPEGREVPAVVYESKDITGLDLLKERQMPKCAISISLDDRGDGWCLYRFDDHPAVDFSVLEGRPDIVFAHKGGFVAKTTAMGIEQALELAKLAVK